MKDNLLIVFTLISLLAICSCDKNDKDCYRRQIINFMNINTINVLCGVIINQALNENGNHENSK